MQPSDIFYALVIEDNGPSSPKKTCRGRAFTNYIAVESPVQTRESQPVEKTKLSQSSMQPQGAPSYSYIYSISDYPTLFKAWGEACNHYEKAREVLLKKDSTYEFAPKIFIQTFRLTESNWSEGANYKYSSIQDARRLCPGMLHYETIAQHVKKLAGKVLTIIDAAYVNENQNKAVKDLAKNSFRSQLSDLWNNAFEDPNNNESSVESPSDKDILD